MLLALGLYMSDEGVLTLNYNMIWITMAEIFIARWSMIGLFSKIKDHCGATWSYTWNALQDKVTWTRERELGVKTKSPDWVLICCVIKLIYTAAKCALRWFTYFIIYCETKLSRDPLLLPFACLVVNFILLLQIFLFTCFSNHLNTYPTKGFN